MPDRLAAQHRHVPPARRPFEPLARGHAEGPPVPADPRRAGRMHRAARRGARRSPRRHPPAALRRSTSSPSRSWPRSRAQRVAHRRALSSSCAAPRPYTRADPRDSSTRCSSSWRTASRPAAARAAATCTTTPSTASCARARARRLAAATSGGAIPEIGDYRVVAEPDDTFIGTVNEDWAVESMAGDIFLLGTHSWQIRRVEAGVVRVRDAGDDAADGAVLDGRGAGAHRRAVRGGVGAARRASTTFLARRRPRRRPRGGSSRLDRHRRRRRGDDRRLPRGRPRRARRRRPPCRRSCSSGSSTRPAACSSCPLAVRRPHQPRARARAAQEVLPHVQLRAAGRRHRRRDRAVARPAPQLPARRGRRATCSSDTVDDTLRAGDARRADVPARAGAGTSTAR